MQEFTDEISDICEGADKQLVSCLKYPCAVLCPEFELGLGFGV